MPKKNPLLQVIIAWLPLAFLATMLCGLVYVTVQQDIRTSANDPQIQIAEDTTAALNAQRLPQDLVSSGRVDMRQSLAPYLIIFDTHGQPISSSVQLDGKIPLLPASVFSNMKNNPGERRFTWQPREGVRSAVVVVSYHDGFVLAGRSLREVEKRENALSSVVFGGWIVSLIGTIMLILVCNKAFYKKV